MNLNYIWSNIGTIASIMIIIGICFVIGGSGFWFYGVMGSGFDGRYWGDPMQKDGILAIKIGVIIFVTGLLLNLLRLLKPKNKGDLPPL